MALEAEGLRFNGPSDFLRNFSGAGQPGLGQEKDELFSPEPGGNVGVPTRGSQVVRHLFQDVISRGMPQVVVDTLEMIQVHEHDGQRLRRVLPAAS